METNANKFVEFEKYCKTCVHKDISEKDEPCNECLSNPVNLYSHKPFCWKEGNLKGNK